MMELVSAIAFLSTLFIIMCHALGTEYKGETFFKAVWVGFRMIMGLMLASVIMISVVLGFGWSIGTVIGAL